MELQIHFPYISTECTKDTLFLPLRQKGPQRQPNDSISQLLKSGTLEALSCLLMLGSFEKLRNVTMSFVSPVCQSDYPFVRMEQPGSYWMDFHEI